MLERIAGFGMGTYLLWGLGIAGLLMKLFFSSYLSGMISATENMATTRKKCLRIMRQKYENCRSLGRSNKNNQAYVEKNVRRLKFFALPIEFWRKSGQLIIAMLVFAMSGAFFYYDSNWLLSRDMFEFLISGIMVGAFLIIVENIFLVNNKMEIVKANISDYFENLAVGWDKNNGSNQFFIERVDDIDQEKKTSNSNGKKDEQIAVASMESAAALSDEKRSLENSSRVKKQGNEEALNSFLKEFFS